LVEVLLQLLVFIVVHKNEGEFSKLYIALFLAALYALKDILEFG